MSYHDQLVEEINKELNYLAANGQKWVPRWIAHAICSKHDRALQRDNEHADFWQHCGYRETRRMTTEIINKRAGDKPKDKDTRKQLVLHGFDREHLQDYYVVIREGDEIGVLVTDLTDEEIDAKAAIYIKMSEACRAHARELARFKQWRTKAKVS